MPLCNLWELSYLKPNPARLPPGSCAESPERVQLTALQLQNLYITNIAVQT